MAFQFSLNKSITGRHICLKNPRETSLEALESDNSLSVITGPKNEISALLLSRKSKLREYCEIENEIL